MNAYFVKILHFSFESTAMKLFINSKSYFAAEALSRFDWIML